MKKIVASLVAVLTFSGLSGVAFADRVEAGDLKSFHASYVCPDTDSFDVSVVTYTGHGKRTETSTFSDLTELETEALAASYGLSLDVEAVCGV